MSKSTKDLTKAKKSGKSSSGNTQKKPSLHNEENIDTLSGENATDNTMDISPRSRPALGDNTVTIDGKLSRSKRTPFHEQIKEVLTGAQRPGWKRHYFNEKEPERVFLAEKAGWQICYCDENGSMVGEKDLKNPNLMGKIVRKTINRYGETAVLMEIPLELYNLDQNAKATERKGQMESMLNARNSDLHVNSKDVTYR